MAQTTQRRPATIDDLYRVEGKAELIGGRIVEMSPTGFLPNQVAGRIYQSLMDYVRTGGRGYALTDNMGFSIPRLPSGRESFSPDVSYYDGPLPKNRMRFIEGAPTFAVEIHSEGDYGPAAERELAAKRADYFNAGTKVVWDVDPLAETIRVYRLDHPNTSTIFGRSHVAEAEPGVPGWRIVVDDLFPDQP